MSETMQAVVCHGPRDYRLETVAVPQPGVGEIPRPRRGMRHLRWSDLKCYHGAAKFWGDNGRAAWAETEVIPGHEFVGEVVQLDEAATERFGVGVGDRVVSEQIVPCWDVPLLQARPILDVQRPRHLRLQAGHARGYGRATWSIPSTSLVHKVSKDVPARSRGLRRAARLRAARASSAPTSPFEDVVVIAGCGPIGLGMVAGAKAKSAGHW